MRQEAITLLLLLTFTCLALVLLKQPLHHPKGVLKRRALPFAVAVIPDWCLHLPAFIALARSATPARAPGIPAFTSEPPQ